MTMHIYFNQDKDGYKEGQSCYVERTLARRFCEIGVAIPYQKHLDNIYDAEQAKKPVKKKKLKRLQNRSADKWQTMQQAQEQEYLI